MTLFWSTRALTDAKEDHLTAFFAAALTHVEPFRKGWADLVLGPHAERNGWDRPEIRHVDLQPEFAGTGCRPDLRLTLTAGQVIVCEHKIDAPETLGAEDERGQLERYLSLPVDGLVYVRQRWAPPGPSVVANPRYVRPRDRDHFLWSDFFPLLSSGDHLLVVWLREAFERLGYTPPNPNAPSLTLRPVGAEILEMEDFAKHWGRLETLAHQLGWTVQGGSYVQRYLVNNSRSLAGQILISPESKGAFLVRFTPAQPSALDLIVTRVRVAASALPSAPTVSIASGSYRNARVKVVDVRTTKDAVFGAERLAPGELEVRLLQFVEPLIRSVLVLVPS